MEPIQQDLPEQGKLNAAKIFLEYSEGNASSSIVPLKMISRP